MGTRLGVHRNAIGADRSETLEIWVDWIDHQVDVQRLLGMGAHRRNDEWTDRQVWDASPSTCARVLECCAAKSSQQGIETTAARARLRSGSGAWWRRFAVRQSRFSGVVVREMNEFDAAAALWVIDLDGVIRLGDQPIPGAAEAVAELQTRGATVVFAPNNSSLTRGGNEAKLARYSIDATGAVVSSAMAAATLVEPGETVLACGGAGVHEALAARGVIVVDQGPADAVVVGWTAEFDFDMLTRAARAIHGGARLIGTNPDSTLPAASDLMPGCGSLVAAVAMAGGVEPAFAGKPHEPLAAYIHNKYGQAGIVVGDRLDTDGAFAATLGLRFALVLVLTGVTNEADLPVEPAPDIVAPDLATLVRDFTGRAASN